MRRILTLLCGLAICLSAAQADDKLWTHVSGSWSVDTNGRLLSDSKARARIAGYTEIHDMNSVQSASNLEKLTRLSAEFELLSPMPDNKAMVFFGAPTQKSFYALRLTGSMEKITSVSIIRSAVKDTTLPFAARNNVEIKEIVSAPVSFKWGESINAEVKTRKKKLTVTVNGKELECTMDEPLPAGMIGFSHANNLMRIHSVKAFSGDDVIFEDDFSKNRIKKLSFTAEKVKK